MARESVSQVEGAGEKERGRGRRREKESIYNAGLVPCPHNQHAIASAVCFALSTKPPNTTSLQGLKGAQKYFNFWKTIYISKNLGAYFKTIITSAPETFPGLANPTPPHPTPSPPSPLPLTSPCFSLSGTALFLVCLPHVHGQLQRGPCLPVLTAVASGS